MANIGVKELIDKKLPEMNDYISTFIKTSLNVRHIIIEEKDNNTCMLNLLRDTYMCNLIFRYVGLMTLITVEKQWIIFDEILEKYIHDYYSNTKFKKKITDMYNYYLDIYTKTKTNYDYCKFLYKIINKCDIPKKNTGIKKTIDIIENKIYNVLNSSPVIRIPKKYMTDMSINHTLEGDNIIIKLNSTTYNELINSLDDIGTRQRVEECYISRTHDILVDFSNLIFYRKVFAENAGYNTYFKYINKDKNDNSEVIKELITDLTHKINKQTDIELERISQYYSKSIKISSCDIIKYTRLYQNNEVFTLSNIIDVIFTIINRFFSIVIVSTHRTAWSPNVLVYNIHDQKTQKLLGRLYIDAVYNKYKKITTPLSIKLADKMQINPENISCAEIALLTNYAEPNKLTYNDVILLFREFGYVVTEMCYESRVGKINHDDEFAQYVPALMEHIAWDRNTIEMIVREANKSASSDNIQFIIDHIEMSRRIAMCTNLKLKCVNAKFDHLLHNSEPLMEIIIDTIEKKKEAGNIIKQTYMDIYKDIMMPHFGILTDKLLHIYPDTIIQEINGSHGTLYANLMNEIFAYSSYHTIINNKKVDFRKYVLNDGVRNYRDLVRNYFEKTNIDYFTLYIKNVVNPDIEELDIDAMTETANGFRTNYNDSDKDDIIHIAE